MPTKRRSRQVSPLEFYGLAAIAMVAAGTFLLYRRYSWSPVEAWFITVNIEAMLFFGYDKVLAWSGRNRVPEKVLFGLSFIGGSPGGLAAMILFWHKIKKPNFQRVFWAIVVLQVFVGSVWFFMIR